jgi:CHASE2 domain-containing sensor protein
MLPEFTSPFSRDVPLIRLGVFLACSLTLILLTILTPQLGWFRQFEHWTDDVRTLLLSDSLAGQHPKIAVVLIDDNTLRHFKVSARSPLDREMLAKIVELVKDSGAGAVGIDVFFARRTTQANDDTLVETLKKPGIPIILGAADDRAPMESWQRDFQSGFLGDAGRPAGFLNLRKEGGDEVVRYHPNAAADPRFPFSFSLLLARTLNPETLPAEGRRIAWLNPPSDGTKLVFRTVLAHHLEANDGSQLPKVTGGSQLKGRIVLIGANFARDDQHRTPFNVWQDEKMPGVAVHAQMTADLLAPNRAVRDALPWAVRTLIVVLGAGGLLVGWLLSRSPVSDLLGWGLATVLLIGINAVAFYYWRTTFPFLLSAFAWVVGVAGGRSFAVLMDWYAAQKADSPSPLP